MSEPWKDEGRRLTRAMVATRNELAAMEDRAANLSKGESPRMGRRTDDEYLTELDNRSKPPTMPMRPGGGG
jgi:hypothetical protein